MPVLSEQGSQVCMWIAKFGKLAAMVYFVVISHHQVSLWFFRENTRKCNNYVFM